MLKEALQYIGVFSTLFLLYSVLYNWFMLAAFLQTKAFGLLTVDDYITGAMIKSLPVLMLISLLLLYGLFCSMIVRIVFAIAGLSSWQKRSSSPTQFVPDIYGKYEILPQRLQVSPSLYYLLGIPKKAAMAVSPSALTSLVCNRIVAALPGYSLIVFGLLIATGAINLLEQAFVSSNSFQSITRFEFERFLQFIVGAAIDKNSPVTGGAVLVISGILLVAFDHLRVRIGALSATSVSLGILLLILSFSSALTDSNSIRMKDVDIEITSTSRGKSEPLRARLITYAHNGPLICHASPSSECTARMILWRDIAAITELSVGPNSSTRGKLFDVPISQFP